MAKITKLVNNPSVPLLNNPTSQPAMCCGWVTNSNMCRWHFNSTTKQNGYSSISPSSETQGQLVGAGKSLNGRGKKSGEEKSRTKYRSPWDSSLNRPVPKPFKVLACDWAQKIFLCPIRVQLFSCPFRDFLFEGVHRQTLWSPVRHLFTCSCRRVSLDRKVPLKRESWNRKKTSKFSMFVNQPEKASTEKIRLWTNRR